MEYGRQNWKCPDRARRAVDGLMIGALALLLLGDESVKGWKDGAKVAELTLRIYA